MSLPIGRIWPVARLFFMGSCILAVYACGQPRDEGYSPSGNEPSLREGYPGFPVLPASLGAFNTAVANAGLRSEARVKSYVGGGPLTCPKPLRAPEDVRERVDRCLMIYGRDSSKFSEQYVAFIDAKSSVMFVENWYQYSAR